jgi:hypothetical protein
MWRKTMRLQKLTGTLVAVGSALLGAASHFGKTVLLDTLTGSTYTLPAATGSGGRIKVVERVAATSNSHIVKVANSVDVMVGQSIATIAAGGAASGFATVAASDTITLNRTTTGGASNGAHFDFEDVAPGIWAVRGVVNASATPATPFSATV